MTLSVPVSAIVTGPVNAIAPAAPVLLLVISPPNEIPPSPIKVISPVETVPPKVIVPEPVPSSRVRASSAPALVMFPEIEIFPPLVFTSKSPLLRVKVPVSPKSPPSPLAVIISTVGVAAVKVVLPIRVTFPDPKSYSAAPIEILDVFALPMSTVPVTPAAPLPPI